MPPLVISRHPQPMTPRCQPRPPPQPWPIPPPLVWLGVPPKRSVSGGTVRLKSDGDSDDGATTGVSWTPRPERLTAVVHRRAEMGRAECERSKSAYCFLPFSRPSPPVLARCLRCLGEAVVQRRRAQTPDGGGAQAGGASPPFTVCVHSRFEVFGGRRAAGRGWGGGGRARWGRGSESDEWQVWCSRRRIASLSPVM